MIVKPPKNCWAQGYPVHYGQNEKSLNKTSLFSHENNIKPNQERLIKSFHELKKTIELAGLEVSVFDFPDSLTEKNHDAVFIRDPGFMFKDYWIQANFNAKKRMIESQTFSEIIKEKFNKKIIILPEDAFL